MKIELNIDIDDIVDIDESYLERIVLDEIRRSLIRHTSEAMLPLRERILKGLAPRMDALFERLMVEWDQKDDEFIFDKVNALDAGTD